MLRKRPVTLAEIQDAYRSLDLAVEARFCHWLLTRHVTFTGDPSNPTKLSDEQESVLFRMIKPLGLGAFNEAMNQKVQELIENLDDKRRRLGIGGRTKRERTEQRNRLIHQYMREHPDAIGEDARNFVKSEAPELLIQTKHGRPISIESVMKAYRLWKRRQQG